MDSSVARGCRSRDWEDEETDHIAMQVADSAAKASSTDRQALHVPVLELEGSSKEGRHRAMQAGNARELWTIESDAPKSIVNERRRMASGDRWDALGRVATSGANAVTRCTWPAAPGPLKRDLNGCIELMIQIFGEDAGKAARSAVGVASLPANAPIEIEAIF